MMKMDRIDKIVSFIKERVPFTPDVLIILGSGLGAMANNVEDKIVIRYE